MVIYRNLVYKKPEKQFKNFKKMYKKLILILKDPP